MTRENAKALLPIIKAYAEGKEIEIFDKTIKMWKTIMLPYFNCDSNIYRIKSEQKKEWHYDKKRSKKTS